MWCQASPSNLAGYIAEFLLFECSPSTIRRFQRSMSEQNGQSSGPGGTWITYPCPKCRSSRSDADSVCPQCHWQPPTETPLPEPVLPKPLPRSVVKLRRTILFAFFGFVATNSFPRNFPAPIVIGWPGFDDPNWVRSFQVFGFPFPWLSLTNNSNRVLQIEESGWMIYFNGLAFNTVVIVCLMIAYFTVGIVASKRQKNQ